MLNNNNKVLHKNGDGSVPERKDANKWREKLCRNLMELSSKIRILSATNC